jgi:hypothetical protein
MARYIKYARDRIAEEASVEYQSPFKFQVDIDETEGASRAHA